MHVEALEDRRLLTITVNTLIDEFDGSIVDGDISLRDAIAAAPTGETIDFAVNGTILLDAALGGLTIDKNLRIDGQSADHLTIDADGNSRVISIDETVVAEISGLTITGGFAGDGGGLHNQGTLELTDSVVTGNRASQKGGGIFSSGSITISGSTLSSNSTSGSGGGVAAPAGIVTVNDSTISGNSASFSGAALDSDGALVYVARSTVSYNDGNGNIFSNFFGTLTIDKTLIRGNSAHYHVITNDGPLSVFDSMIDSNSGAGAIRHYEGPLTVVGSTISEHGFGISSVFDAVTLVTNSTLSGNGIGIVHENGQKYGGNVLSIENSTISGNGRGIDISSDIYGGEVSASIMNSVISGNAGAEVTKCQANVNFGGINLIGDSSKTTDEALIVPDVAYGYYTCGSGFSVGGNQILATSNGNTPTPIDGILDTLLSDNGGRTLTHALVLNSPAIDAGVGSGGSLFDQRGEPFVRVFGPRIDIGAFELQPPPVTCDFDGNSACDLPDIDALVGAIAKGTNDPLYDLTGDTLVDLADRDAWLVEAGAVNLPSGNPYLLGDANLDGIVDGQDFLVWNLNKFTATAAWSQSDFNADGQTDGQDFVIWNMFKFQESDKEEALRSQGARSEGFVPFLN
ncbi:MAG: choice-of-anchor Q domain-containing protein [Planctomycetota bacterium]